MASASKLDPLDEADACQSSDTSQTTLIDISNSSFENISVQADVAFISQQAEKFSSQSKDASTKRSINNFRQPPKAFIECRTFTDATEKLKTKQSLILHLHGFPGSGKTAIARKVAANFPFDKNENIFVKYLIECSDNNEDVEGSLKKLVEEMWDCKLIGDKAACKTAIGRLQNKITAELTALLEEAAVPILIVIEDPPETDIDLLCDLASSIASKSFRNKVHLCITSKSKSICNFFGLKTYEPAKVHGLSEEEGLRLLGVSDEYSEIEQKAAKQIISDLGGSPLGLLAVRNTCLKFRKSYEKYLEFPRLFHHSETENHVEGQGLHKKHTYQALITLLDKKGMWETMKILSFFHHGGIPQRLIGIIKQMQRTLNDQGLLQTCSDNEDESGEFIFRLEDFGFCEVKGNGYHDTTITLHQVVFKAVRRTMKDDERIPTLQQAVFALSSVVHKDLRKEVYEAFMRSMIPHLQSVLDFVDSFTEVLNDFVTSMAVGHLREAYGCAATTDDKGSAEKSLLMGARTIWDEVCKRSGIEMDFSVLVNQQTENAANVAVPIVEACKLAGENLQKNDDYLYDYISLVTQFKDDELLFLSNLSQSSKVSEILKAASEHCVRITPDTLHMIRLSSHGKIFLGTTKHYQVFFVDRLASVLYTLGRLSLRDKSITPEKRAQFTWVSDMTHALCEQCSQQTGVKLLFLRLSAISRVNVRLENSSATQGVTEKRDGLKVARSMAESNLDNAINQTSDAFYENGLRKSMESNIFDKLSNYRCIVRINTRLRSLCSTEDSIEALGQNPDLFYQHLQALAKEHIDKWKFSPKCLVYCGKYMASLGNYKKAIEHFQRALLCQAVIDDKGKLFPWVCYNYARAIMAGKMDAYKQDAIDKCNEALQNEEIIASNLSDKLLEVMDKLESLPNSFFCF